MVNVLANVAQEHFAKNEHLHWQMVGILMESEEGSEALAATGDTQTVHLDCAVQHQALHGSSAELQSMASKVLSQLRSKTASQCLQPPAEKQSNIQPGATGAESHGNSI